MCSSAGRGDGLPPDAIRALRARLGLTQVGLAARLGCHPQTVAWWEQGRSRPTGLYAVAIRRLMREQVGRIPADLEEKRD